jgi:hypothetical protein
VDLCAASANDHAFHHPVGVKDSDNLLRVEAGDVVSRRAGPPRPAER